MVKILYKPKMNENKIISDKIIKYSLTSKGFKSYGINNLGQVLCAINSQTLTFDEIKASFESTTIINSIDSYIKREYLDIINDLSNIIEKAIENGYIKVN